MVSIVGDLNARTGDLSDYLSDFTSDENIEDIVRNNGNDTMDSMHRSSRNNSDKTINQYGKRITELCKSFKIRILNGRTPGDTLGAFTCFQYNGCSTVDYIICSEEAMYLIPCMTVSPMTHLSDHCYISCHIQANDNIFIEKPRQNHVHKSGYHWNSNSVDIFKSALKLPTFQFRLTQLSKKTLDANGYCEELTDILQSVAKFCLKQKKKKPHNNTNNKRGFDNECMKLKQHVICLGKLVSRYPKDIRIYTQFINQKKIFKKLVKQKSRESRNALLQEISSCEQKNPKKFWSLLRKLRGSKQGNKTPIDISQWSDYFRNLHNPAEKANLSTSDETFEKSILDKLDQNIGQDNNDEILNTPFELDEVQQAMRMLKARKAPGLDNINNEMLIAGAKHLIPHICKLFNIIRESEMYPNAWSEGYIVPIFKTGDKTDPTNYRGISICNSIGKLFAVLVNNRLQTFLSDNSIISKYQIGFMKHKRTSDHIFVLKCLIEYYKSKRKPIYGCFIDLRKAFDSVWIKGLLYKMIYKYKISPKLVRVLNSMYSNLRARVCCDNQLGYSFGIALGTRQGCNLSPTLFNLFINDLPGILAKCNCDPVSLNTIEINVLMYADDMLLLSKSSTGLKRSLKVIDTYCRKWKLSINTNKTQIMIFNKRKINDISFELGGNFLEVVKTYNYLGIRISSSGSFVPAIKELSDKAIRAFFSLKNSLTNTNTNPRVLMKLYDSLIKPISTYAAEVWGAFGHKPQHVTNMLEHIYQKLKSPYEVLHLKACKWSLKVSRRSSNFGVLSELGRYPIIMNIIMAVCKYRVRLDSFCPDDLLFHAISSQKLLSHNSNKSATYHSSTEGLFKILGLSKNISTQSSRDMKMKVKDTFLGRFNSALSHFKGDAQSKLNLYSKLKTDFRLEPHLLNNTGGSYITKFRISDHNLPIERGRYERPKPPRNLRVCTQCHSGVGDEEHALFHCNADNILSIRRKYSSIIYNITPQLAHFSHSEKLFYLLKGHDKDLILPTSMWLSQIVKAHKC